MQRICLDIGCYLEDLAEAVDDTDGWREFGNFVLTSRLDNDDDDIYAN